MSKKPIINLHSDPALQKNNDFGQSSSDGIKSVKSAANINQNIKTNFNIEKSKSANAQVAPKAKSSEENFSNNIVTQKQENNLIPVKSAASPPKNILISAKSKQSTSHSGGTNNLALSQTNSLLQTEVDSAISDPVVQIITTNAETIIVETTKEVNINTTEEITEQNYISNITQVSPSPPGGFNTQIQFNNDGVLDGIPVATYAAGKVNFSIATLSIAGGNNNDVLITDGTGNLSWAAPIGFSGFSGISGYSGYSGFSGQQGISGTSGISGFSSASGISGFSGYSGLSGFSSASGISGFSGVSGYSGLSGSGISGASGLSGRSGYSGQQGSPGPSGISGFSGSGISGISGFSGSGISGFSGYSGVSGFSGISGRSGSGISGISGFSGSGISGFSGYSGVSGYSGYSGSTGISGFSGIPGPGNLIDAINDTTSTALYPVMVNAVGVLSTARASTSKIYFNASTGTIYATSKSFNIPHPTKPGKKLIYGSLEGPENGVYIRGRSQDTIINLPEYWSKLIDTASITVQLTPINRFQKLFVKYINQNEIIIDVEDSESKIIDYYYIIFAERIDIPKLQIEI